MQDKVGGVASKPAKSGSHCRIVHVTEQRSIFSDYGAAANYQGFVNLAMVLLSVNLTRMALENVRKYGLLLAAPSALSTAVILKAAVYSAMGYVVCMPCFLLRHQPVFVGLSYSIVSWIVWPYLFCHFSMRENPAAYCIFVTYGVSMCLKMISFQLYFDEAQRKNDNGTGKMAPVSFKSFAFFLVAPTLCYQVSYPLNERIDPRFLARRLLGLFSAGAMMWVLYGQYMEPTMRNSLESFRQTDLRLLVERLLKLSMSSVLMWLLGFYAFFHCYLNIVAELVCFGDRRFYADWWNAHSLEEYWRLWNVPMHLWLKRHIYGPMETKWQGNRYLAMAAVFVLSATLHEFIIAIPTGIFRGWGFLAIAVQLPLILLFRMVRHRLRGPVMNVLFWVMFCIVGQPLVILLYYCEWQLRNQKIMS